MIFDISSVHRIVVRYCECGHSPSGTEPYIQILRTRWFPATLNRPSTAFTFRLLDFFQKLQDQSKCNPYDFHNTIIQLTDCAGLSPEIVRLRLSLAPYSHATSSQYRYNEITLVIRIWNHLKLLQRGGAGHCPGGVETMEDGSLAITCPACPQPGINTISFPPRGMYD